MTALRGAKAQTSHESNNASPGLIPAILMMNITGKFIKQGGGKRRGAIAVSAEIWHEDIFQFLEMKSGLGPGEFKASVVLDTASDKDRSCR